MKKIQVGSFAVRYSLDVHMKPLLQRALAGDDTPCAAGGFAGTPSTGSSSTPSTGAAKKIKR